VEGKQTGETKMINSYWLGYFIGRWQEFRKRCNLQYVCGYLAGKFSR